MPVSEYPFVLTKSRPVRRCEDSSRLVTRARLCFAASSTNSVEIAREVNVTNSVEALALYRRIATGRCGDGLSDRCETDAALMVERRVLQDLDVFGRR